jgi:hypothetical protein
VLPWADLHGNAGVSCAQDAFGLGEKEPRATDGLREAGPWEYLATAREYSVRCAALAWISNQQMP